jgi:hypothetical protein
MGNILHKKLDTSITSDEPVGIAPRSYINKNEISQCRNDIVVTFLCNYAKISMRPIDANLIYTYITNGDQNANQLLREFCIDEPFCSMFRDSVAIFKDEFYISLAKYAASSCHEPPESFASDIRAVLTGYNADICKHLSSLIDSPIFALIMSSNYKLYAKLRNTWTYFKSALECRLECDIIDTNAIDTIDAYFITETQQVFVENIINMIQHLPQEVAYHMLNECYESKNKIIWGKLENSDYWRDLYQLVIAELEILYT